ncbi:patellin-2-like isoform X2 [Abrus precatorius]|uniref:Patellin-2-like isoform X2 n=1 Tax=Abrus precatorius TaxID=3816 RepID=A0A8B8LDQ9_ABRPR|nr:patellin-2-like isoform X2 [Abrus precatorius]
MAEEPQKPAPAEEVVPVVHTDKDPVAQAPADEAEKPVAADEAEKPAGTTTEEVVVEEAKAQQAGVEEKISQSVSFKEESNVVGDLPEAQKKALDELKKLIQEALNKHELSAPPPPKAPAAEAEKKEDVAAAEDAEKKEQEVAAEEVEKKEEAVATEEVEKKELEVTEKEEEKKESEVVAVQETEKKELEVGGGEEAEKTELEVVAEEVKEVEKKEVEAGGTETEEKEGEKKESEVVGEEEKEKEVEKKEVSPEEVEIWGIPLLADERSDVILLKFLRARDFKVKDAFTMIKNTVRWRKEFGIDALVEEDLGSNWDKVVYSHGYDKEGHPVCYNVFGEFGKKELYQKTFSDEEKREKFIRWRIQFLEKSVRKLDFSPSAISTIVQVNDLKNSPGLAKWEHRQVTNHALQLLQDNYPEFVAKQIFINVPWWYLAFARMINAFLTQRTKSKFVFAGPSKSAETLFKKAICSGKSELWVGM